MFKFVKNRRRSSITCSIIEKFRMNRFLRGTSKLVSQSSRQNASLRYDGRVAVVTGAGNGLGKQYALELGRRGATVIVNDLGGSTSGDGASNTAADQVVQEIKALGGQAVANYANVMDTEAVLNPVLDQFGKIDILINNAGMFEPVSF